MTPVAIIRADLVKLLHTASASAKISFDPMAPEEIEEAYIITRLEVRHRDRQLDMVYYRSAVVTLIAAAKTTADLDALVDALAVTDNRNEGTLRGTTLSSIVYKTDADPDIKTAEVILEAEIVDH